MLAEIYTKLLMMHDLTHDQPLRNTTNSRDSHPSMTLTGAVFRSHKRQEEPGHRYLLVVVSYFLIVNCDEECLSERLLMFYLFFLVLLRRFTRQTLKCGLLSSQIRLRSSGTNTGQHLAYHMDEKHKFSWRGRMLPFYTRERKGVCSGGGAFLKFETTGLNNCVSSVLRSCERLNCMLAAYGLTVFREQMAENRLNFVDYGTNNQAIWEHHADANASIKALNNQRLTI
ncbi:hypothetical protein WUBG_13978 [Wuchereria bancrofti]|uniref:Uncharacterized protein n=1 Tax=Wuchereria bancrofti TaxID=6293 RepID=J9DZ89_WUCBA|nr:hypothetical protein WUBG_13978 [Wuchereria bancrofti]